MEAEVFSMKTLQRRLDRIADDLGCSAKSADEAAMSVHFKAVIEYATDAELHELIAIADDAKRGVFDETRADALMTTIEARWREATEGATS
jgi:hypothetical protein